MLKQSTHVIDAVRRWLETVVIDLNLCPFAKRELVKNRIRFVVSEAPDEQLLLSDLDAELIWLDEHSETETTLLIHPNCLTDFYDYNQFLDLAEILLTQMNRVGVYQIASFHPKYQFGGTAVDDVENYTNRSPYPMLHLIREASLTRVIDDYPNIDSIPENNIALMHKLGIEKMRALLAACAVKSANDVG